MKKILNFCIIAVFFITACTQPEAESETAPTNTPHADEINTEAPTTVPEKETEEAKMEKGKVAVVIARDRYQSLEYNPVVYHLTEAGYEIVVVSDELGTAMGTQENTEIQMAFTDVDTSEFKAIVLIGGSKSLWENEELHSLLIEMQAEGKLVSAICYGTVTLAYAGVIKDGDKVCWYNSTESDPVMESFGIFDTHADVTYGDRMITADGPSSAEEFAKAVAAYLG